MSSTGSAKYSKGTADAREATTTATATATTIEEMSQFGMGEPTWWNKCCFKFGMCKIACFMVCCRCICLKNAERESRKRERVPLRRKNLLMLGFDGAGKSSLLQRMAKLHAGEGEGEGEGELADQGEDDDEGLVGNQQQQGDADGAEYGQALLAVVPTSGFSIKQVMHGGYRWSIWEVGGNERIRQYWNKYTRGIGGLVWVLDASAPEADIDASLASLADFVRVELRHRPHWPLLVLANHGDKAPKWTPEKTRNGSTNTRGSAALDEATTTSSPVSLADRIQSGIRRKVKALLGEKEPYQTAVFCVSAFPEGSQSTTAEEKGSAPFSNATDARSNMIKGLDWLENAL